LEYDWEQVVSDIVLLFTACLSWWAVQLADPFTPIRACLAAAPFFGI